MPIDSCVIFLNQRRHHSVALTDKVTRKKYDKRPGRTHLISIMKTTETDRLDRVRAKIGKEM